MIEYFVFFFVLIVGMGMGWAARSIIFGIDHDCANPEHKDGVAKSDPEA